MDCCCPHLSDKATEDRMKLQQRSSPGEAGDDGAQAGSAAAIAAATAAHVTASAATMPQLPPASVKMAGYLDKRGKRLPTWKRYWFVLDGRLLLYFRSQFDYLQLSPCRGSLNLGLVSGVRPAGSRTAPQLELITRSQTVLLRTKEREVQERWLQALLDAMQLHSPTSTGSHFRYTSASLPQASRRKNKGAVEGMAEESQENDDEEGEEEEGVATDRVLQRIKHIGNQSYGTLAAEIRTVGTGSLRHVTPRTSPHVASGSSAHKVAELTAQLPTNKAVLRLLERRQQEVEELQRHVTTIKVDPEENQPKVEGASTKLDIVAEAEEAKPSDTAEQITLTDITKGEETKLDDKESHDEKKLSITDSKSSASSLMTDDKKSEVTEGLVVENDVYIASPAIVQEDTGYGYEEVPATAASTKGQDDEEDMYEAVPPHLPPLKAEDEVYATIETKDTAAYEPSLPPRPIHEIKQEETKSKKKDKDKHNKTPLASHSVQRKRSFLQRMLGSNKPKKTANVNNKNIPTIKVDEFNDDDYDKDDYETVDYEELLKHRQESEQNLLSEKSVTDEENAGITSAISDSKQGNENNTETIEESSEIQKNIVQAETAVINSYVNVTTMMNTPAIKTESEDSTDLTKKCVTKTVQETNSSIVPIIENEKTHTVTITVQDNRETGEASAAPEIVVDETVRPKLPPRRSSSSGSLGTPLPRPVSPWHDVPTNNAPVIAKSKRRSSELLCTTMPLDLVTDLENEDCDIHKTIINIAGNNDQIVQPIIEIETNKIPKDTKDIKNENIVDKIQEAKPNLITNGSADLSPVSNLVQKSGEPCESCTLRCEFQLGQDETKLLDQLQDTTRCSHKHHSADELDILLRQLSQITNLPLHSASVSALEPLRKRRLGSDPDYDVPRPHHLYLSLMPSDTADSKKQPEDIMEATRFFNEPDLYYARPLSEYLQELDQMSNIQHKRTTRASKAFQKWIEESQDIFPSMGNLYNDYDHDIKKTSTPHNSMTEEVIDEDSCLFLNIENEENSIKDDNNVDTVKQVVEMCEGKEEIKEILPLENVEMQNDLENKEIQSPGSIENMAEDLCPKEEVKELHHEEKEIDIIKSTGSEQVSANTSDTETNKTEIESKQVSSDLEICEVKECAEKINLETGEVCPESLSEIEKESSDESTTENETTVTSDTSQTTEEPEQKEAQTEHEHSTEDKELVIKVADIMECADDTLTHAIDIPKIKEVEESEKTNTVEENYSIVSSVDQETTHQTNGHVDQDSCIFVLESGEKISDDEKNLSDSQQDDESLEITSAETHSDTGDDALDGVALRNKKTMVQDAVRLSFAMAESVVIEEETVNIMNTPQHSPSFTFSPQ